MDNGSIGIIMELKMTKVFIFMDKSEVHGMDGMKTVKKKKRLILHKGLEMGWPIGGIQMATKKLLQILPRMIPHQSQIFLR